MNMVNLIDAELKPLPAVLRKFGRGAFQPGVRIAALSMPRGNAKSFLAAKIASMLIDPHGPFFFLKKKEEGALGFSKNNESIVVSASLEQCRVIFGFVREILRERNIEDHYSFLDSNQKLLIKHKTLPGLRLRAISSSGKRAMGLASFNVILLDEPASLRDADGRLLWDAIRQACGKRPGQRCLLFGTLAPSEPGSWFPSLIAGGTDKETGTFVQSIQADAEANWKDWEEVKRVNPMFSLNRTLRETVRKEHKEALKNEYLARSFQAYRLNRLVETKMEMLIPLDQWQEVEQRDVPERSGRCILGLDLGSNRSWSAAWALWENGRSECWALCGGIPDLAAREKQDSVPDGLYRALHAQEVLLTDLGLRVARPEILINHLKACGVEPMATFADRFLEGTLQDVIPQSWNLIFRKTRWSEATEDITGFRKLVLDGPLSIIESSRSLAKFALSQSIVVEDEGNLRISKRRKWKSRDDVSICASLACGAMVRHLARKPVSPGLRWAVVN